RRRGGGGKVEIFNVGVGGGKGRWIHILHDDDWIGPCFYKILYEGVKNAPAAGAAFCRHQHVDDSGKRIRDSSLERETPGVLDNWLDAITTICRLQTPSIVVRR